MRTVLFTVLLMLLSAACTVPAQLPATATPEPTATPEWAREGWQLVWHDEFEGSEINPDYWTHEVGGHGWGNGEGQFYTEEPDNSFVEDGYLVIQALEERMLGKRYTSARLTTRDKVTVQYGRVEARIKLPYGQGVWPAFWMLGSNIDKVGWPFSGEIDIVENIGSEPHLIHGTVHGPRYSGGNGVGSPQRLADGRYADDFHLFAIEWQENQIRWFVDDEPYFRVTETTLPGDWVFNQEFFMILNVAVGGEWPGYPDESTTFPQTMLVDYVRVYQRANDE